MKTTLLSALTNQASGTLATGASPRRLGNAHPGIAPYEVFAAKDCRLVIGEHDGADWHPFTVDSRTNNNL